MDILGKTVAITGGAGGIGIAMAKRFKAEGAAGVIIADLDAAGPAEIAAEIGVTGIACDVTSETSIKQLIAGAEAAHGDIDIFCSNAGVFHLGDENAPDDQWQLNWDVHVMAHIYAARDLAPKMAARGGGYLVNTSSAAGVLTHIDSATYSVTKHAAVAFAEWLSITYGDRGVKISVLCPQAVRTAMIAGREGETASIDGIMEPETLADAMIANMAREEFYILPHKEVREYMRRRAFDPERWLGGMRRLRAKIAHKE